MGTDRNDQQCWDLVAVAKDLRNKYKGELEGKKEKGMSLLKRSDFLWYELLVSYSTWGGSRGYERMIKDATRYQQITYEEMKRLGSKEARVDRLLKTMNEAGVRFHKKKAPMLAQCFDKIEEMSGLGRAQETLLGKTKAEEMIRFLDEFPGIGPKYARDIMMDSYHPLFRDKIALDSRVRSLSKVLGLNFKNYDDHENFYLCVAKEAGIEGWELDRLIYNHIEEFLAPVKRARDDDIKALRK